uniref:Uncharacterized protein n=1 Tax=Rangifer tarandus platyrhynchus TaxID=3082113 RepID=A0ACB0FBH3_RANTA|nr:unnamed protein product [Rangifer tarandus platyrhynchus]
MIWKHWARIPPQQWLANGHLSGHYLQFAKLPLLPFFYILPASIKDITLTTEAASPEDKGKAGAARPPALPPRRCPELWTPRNPGQDAPPSWNCRWPGGARRQAPKIGWVASGYGFRLHSVLGALGMREADSAPRCWSESSLKITPIAARG